MTSLEPTTTKYYAGQVAAYTDAELDRYLNDHRLEDGAMFVEVEDPENLPQTFIQRLRDRANRTSEKDQSHPVDPDQLISRLLGLSSDRHTSPRPQASIFGITSPAETELAEPPEEGERTCHDELLEDGGRPLYPIDLVDAVSQDPSSHFDMLRPWLDHYLDFDPNEGWHIDWCVFHVQLRSWHNFRIWQQLNREDTTRWDMCVVKNEYNWFVKGFRRQSPTYTEAVKKLLAEYGFTRPFQFHDDPTQQDKLTTWIEYLGYECWVHYRYARRAKRLQPDYDAAWKRLVDSGVLRPFETEAFVCDPWKSGVLHDREQEQATRAFQSAQAAGNAVLTRVFSDMKHPRGPRLTPAARLEMMLAAKARIEAALEELLSTQKRDDLCTKFMQSTGGYRENKRTAERNNFRLRWIMEQIPLIEAESNESSTAKTLPEPARGVKRNVECDEDSGTSHSQIKKKRRRDDGERSRMRGSKDGPGKRRAKLKRSRDDPADEPPLSKRTRRGGDDLGSHDKTSNGADAGRRAAGDQVAAKTAERPNQTGNNSSMHRKSRPRNAGPSSTTAQPLRRSARISARQEPVQTILTESGAATRIPRSSRRRAAPLPTSPSRTRSQEQESSYRAMGVREHEARVASQLDRPTAKKASK